MTLQELEIFKNRTVIFRGKREIIDKKGAPRVQLLLLDEKTKNSVCIARLEEVDGISKEKTNTEPH